MLNSLIERQEEISLSVKEDILKSGIKLECSTKISKVGFNSTCTVKLQMFKLDLEKAEEPEIILPTSAGSLKKQESSRKKTSISALLTMSKPLTV